MLVIQFWLQLQSQKVLLMQNKWLLKLWKPFSLKRNATSSDTQRHVLSSFLNQVPRIYKLKLWGKCKNAGIKYHDQPFFRRHFVVGRLKHLVPSPKMTFSIINYEQPFWHDLVVLFITSSSFVIKYTYVTSQLIVPFAPVFNRRVDIWSWQPVKCPKDLWMQK